MRDPIQSFLAEAKLSNVIKQIVTFSVHARADDVLSLCDSINQIIEQQHTAVNQKRGK